MFKECNKTQNDLESSSSGFVDISMEMTMYLIDKEVISYD